LVCCLKNFFKPISVYVGLRGQYTFILRYYINIFAIYRKHAAGLWQIGKNLVQIFANLLDPGIRICYS
jgi:hypothetical protein